MTNVLLIFAFIMYGIISIPILHYIRTQIPNLEDRKIITIIVTLYMLAAGALLFVKM